MTPLSATTHKGPICRSRKRASSASSAAAKQVEKLFDEGLSEQQVLAEKPLADLDKKWAANDQQAQNWTRMVYNSFKRS
jgi:NAD(P)H-dependent FMN reductase